MPDLRRRALAEIRQQAGCHNVQDIAINRGTDERAALYVQGVLRRDYNLMTD